MTKGAASASDTASAAPERAEKVYEGRGDMLSDARMSWIDGRAADDMRLKGLHMRLLLHVGRQNHRRGWLRLSQTELAEAWGVHRSSINRYVAQLVEWGYLDKREQADTGESFCVYKVRLDDGDVAPQKHDRRGGVPPIGHTGGVPPIGHTSVTSQVTPVCSPRSHPLSIEEKPTITDIRRTLPPTPREPGRAEGEGGCAPVVDEQGTARGRSGEGQPPLTSPPAVRFTRRWDRAARDAVAGLAGAAPHVAAMIAAVCGTLHPPADADGAAWIDLAGQRLSGFAPAVLADVAARMIAERKRDVAPIGDLLAWAAEAAARHAAAAADAEATAHRARLEAQVLARLAPGVEPGAAPQRQDALALRRQFVATVADGAAIDHAWLQSLLVLDRTGERLLLSADTRVAARYIEATSLLESQLVSAARALWPQVRTLQCRVHGSDMGAAA